MTTTDENNHQTLVMEHSTEVADNDPPYPPMIGPRSLNTDFEKVRDSYYGAIGDAIDLYQEISGLAKQSQDAKLFSTALEAIRIRGEVTAGLAKARKDFTGGSSGGKGTVVVNQPTLITDEERMAMIHEGLARRKTERGEVSN
jgi:hypothetical protein